MRTAQYQHVRTGVAHRRDVTAQQVPRVVVVDGARLDALRESRRLDGPYRDLRAVAVDQRCELLPARRTGRDEKRDLPGHRALRRGLQRWLHAHERHVERRPQVGDRRARRRIARDDDELRAAFEQLARDGVGALPDLGREAGVRTGSRRCPRSTTTSSPGSRRFTSASTASPPTPESYMPMGEEASVIQEDRTIRAMAGGLGRVKFGPWNAPDCAIRDRAAPRALC